MVAKKAVFFVLLGSVCLSPAGAASPPPVILIDGYHLTCDATAPSSNVFGDLEKKLNATSTPVVFFNPCAFSGKPSIEFLADTLAQRIKSLNVPQVDVVAYSMGGLIARAYLAGKGVAPGSFQPPADPRIRKLILIATPNFGALLGGALAGFAPDQQARDLVPGSQFLYDLATWNQGHDDLRGVDAIAVLGNAAGLPGLTGASDGLVPVTSASLTFTRPDERTRVIPYCHSDDILSVLLGGGCNAPPIAKVQSDDHLTWRIVRSFLADTTEWKSIGTSPANDPILSRYGGVLAAYETNNGDVPSTPPSLTFARDPLSRGPGLLFFRDFVPAGGYTIRASDSQTALSFTGQVVAGGYNVLLLKSGPRADLIAPAAARLNDLALAPDMIVSLYGSGLASAALSINGVAVPVTYSSDRQVNAILPRDVSGYVTLMVTNAGGRHSVNLWIQPVVPAVFTIGVTQAAAAVRWQNGLVVSAANPVRSGEYVLLYATGLGAPPAQAQVTVGGLSAQVTYSGAAPGFPGVNQINFIVPPGVPSGATVPLVVQAGQRTSNVTYLAVTN